MKVFKAFDNTSCIEFCRAVIKLLLVPKDGPELSTQAGLHQHVQVSGVSEGTVQLDNERAGA